jgi:hypothetical protein
VSIPLARSDFQVKVRLRRAALDKCDNHAEPSEAEVSGISRALQESRILPPAPNGWPRGSSSGSPSVRYAEAQRLNGLRTDWPPSSSTSATAGGPFMIGSSLSFARIEGKARLYETPGETALVVTISVHDDRAEHREDVRPAAAKPVNRGRTVYVSYTRSFAT